MKQTNKQKRRKTEFMRKHKNLDETRKHKLSNSVRNHRKLNRESTKMHNSEKKLEKELRT